MEQNRTALSVGEVNLYLKMLLDGDRVLSNVWVRGEISNFKIYSSGHMYFTLKDEEGQIRAVMFSGLSMRLPFVPRDGMKVLAHGRVSVYTPRGEYQIQVDSMQPDGVGSLAMRYEQLRRKLESEGLFDEARKKPLPPFPRRVGIITSPTGAAIHDMINVLGRRMPMTEIILFPSAVQGAEAPEQLLLGLYYFQSCQAPPDVIIIGRGGGSAEDLWAFNDEMLCRAVADCRIPVISAVGHESDFTICDFVADCRAPTPSAAAELAVPHKRDLTEGLAASYARITSLLQNKLSAERRLFDRMDAVGYFEDPKRLLRGFYEKVGEYDRDLLQATEQTVANKQQMLSSLIGKFEALSPLSVLSRGYAVVTREGRGVLSAEQVEENDLLNIRFAKDSLWAVAKKGAENGKKSNEI